MKNNKVALIGIVAVLVVGGGVWAYTMRDSFGNTVDTSQTATDKSKQSLIDSIPKSDTEKILENFTGDEHDRFYIANMIAHHQGAVDMAKLAQTRAKHSELKTMANDIISAQTTEINNMLGWQKAWGYPATSGEMMVDHSGMATMEEMATATTELGAKTGDEFDKAFLKQMIAHHESAVSMSRPGAKNAGHKEVKDLTKAIIDAQTSEISQMRQWQKDWGYPTTDNSMPSAH